MHAGSIDLTTLSGGFDAYLTLESGQSYRWWRSDGEMYAGQRTASAWYETVLDGEVIRIRQRACEDSSGEARSRAGPGDAAFGSVLEWESTADSTTAERAIRTLLRLDDDLDAICEQAPEDPLIEAAYDRYRGLRLVDDPPFDTLIAFICSAQMRVGRIHTMVQALARAYGTTHAVDGRELYEFPSPEALAQATETDLRALGLGYRAPYVAETARMIADGEDDPAAARELPYEDAREYLTRFVGVGEKVADCVCLFSLGFDEAVPLDTWIRTAIADYYPECDHGSYAATSRAIRERLGGQYAGYTQTYLFHALRTERKELEAAVEP